VRGARVRARRGEGDAEREIAVVVFWRCPPVADSLSPERDYDQSTSERASFHGIFRAVKKTN
jgi:hypothetical protein